MATQQQQTKVKGVVDIVFLLDATGSMTSCIGAVKDNIQAFITSLTTKDANNEVPVKDWRAKVVGYRDWEADKGEAFVDQPFVSSVGDLRGQLMCLEAKGGGDEPESLLEALWRVADLPAANRGEAPSPGQWRDQNEAMRAVIIFTDAPFKKKLVEPAGATLEDLQTLLMSKRIVMHIFAPKDFAADYEELSLVQKAVYRPVEGGSTPQESLVKYTSEQANFQETMKKLGQTLSNVAAQPAL